MDDSVWLVNFLTASVVASLGIVGAFWFKERVEKGRWLRAYAFVLHRMLAKVDGHYGKKLGDLAKLAADYENLVQELEAFYKAGKDIHQKVDQLEVPTIAMTLDYNEVFLPLGSDALTRIPKDTVEEIVLYVKTYKNAEIALAQMDQAWSSYDERHTRDCIQNEPGRTIRWHKRYVTLINQYGEAARALGHQGNNIREQLIAKGLLVNIEAEQNPMDQLLQGGLLISSALKVFFLWSYKAFQQFARR